MRDHPPVTDTIGFQLRAVADLARRAQRNAEADSDWRASDLARIASAAETLEDGEHAFPADHNPVARYARLRADLKALGADDYVREALEDEFGDEVRDAVEAGTFRFERDEDQYGYPIWQAELVSWTWCGATLTRAEAIEVIDISAVHGIEAARGTDRSEELAGQLGDERAEMLRESV